jgi:predicted amidohydrolase YtcJ
MSKLASLTTSARAGVPSGDDLFRVAGFGERIGGNNTTSPQFEPTARVIAKHRWMLQQHSITPAENDFHLNALRAIAREYPIDGLRWALIHLQSIDSPRLMALKELGAGASAQTWTYLSAGGGPPFRRIVDSGIPAGVGTDSTNVSALDPWLSLFYMTTGRNLAGMLTNDTQQISRLEALRLYTEGAAWFSFDDRLTGSFVEGKYADLAVLSDDYLTDRRPENSKNRVGTDNAGRESRARLRAFLESPQKLTGLRVLTLYRPTWELFSNVAFSFEDPKSRHTQVALELILKSSPR